MHPNEIKTLTVGEMLMIAKLPSMRIDRVTVAAPPSPVRVSSARSSPPGAANALPRPGAAAPRAWVGGPAPAARSGRAGGDAVGVEDRVDVRRRLIAWSRVRVSPTSTTNRFLTIG